MGASEQIDHRKRSRVTRFGRNARTLLLFDNLYAEAAGSVRHTDRECNSFNFTANYLWSDEPQNVPGIFLDKGPTLLRGMTDASVWMRVNDSTYRRPLITPLVTV